MRALLFDLEHPDGPRRWAIAATDLVAVLPVVAWRPIPGGPPGAIGVFQRQGTLVPLVDLAVRLGGPPARTLLGSRIALVRAEPANPASPLVGFLLERTGEMVEIDFADPSGHPGFDPHGDQGFGPVVVHGGRSVQLLRLDRFFDEATRLHLTGIAP